MLPSELDRGQVVQAGGRPDGVVVLSPRFDRNSGLAAGAEPLDVQLTCPRILGPQAPLSPAQKRKRRLARDCCSSCGLQRGCCYRLPIDANFDRHELWLATSRPSRPARILQRETTASGRFVATILSFTSARPGQQRTSAEFRFPTSRLGFVLRRQQSGRICEAKTQAQD